MAGTGGGEEGRGWFPSGRPHLGATESDRTGLRDRLRPGPDPTGPDPRGRPGRSRPADRAGGGAAVVRWPRPAQITLNRAGRPIAISKGLAGLVGIRPAPGGHPGARVVQWTIDVCVRDRPTDRSDAGGSNPSDGAVGRFPTTTPMREGEHGRGPCGLEGWPDHPGGSGELAGGLPAAHRARPAQPEKMVEGAEDWSNSPEAIADWLAWYDSLEPLVFTPEEAADLQDWRRRVKDTPSPT